MKLAGYCIAMTMLFAQGIPGTAGFQQVTVPDPSGKPLIVGIWYPSNGAVSNAPLGMFTQSVAVNGAVLGNHLSLILISHGTSGSLASHYDTALALAKAGFVVAALTHTGDNYMDQSYLLAPLKMSGKCVFGHTTSAKAAACRSDDSGPPSRIEFESSFPTGNSLAGPAADA
jgi:predicted dienelactone hydrolase